jgi:hypothetical protein
VQGGGGRRGRQVFERTGNIQVRVARELLAHGLQERRDDLEPLGEAVAVARRAETAADVIAIFS